MWEEIILTFAVLGVVINVVAFVIISRKKDKSMFHDLLKILTAYDVAVVICCALQFALPSLWLFYSAKIYPHILQYLLPVLHVTVMTSVYSTILISFERYIRICYHCQLRETNILSEDNVKYYKLFVVMFPILFYIPKCFEVRSYYDIRETKRLVDCNKYISLSNLLENPLLKTLIGSQFTDDDMVNIKFLSEACDNLLKSEKALNQTQAMQQVNSTVLSNNTRQADIRLFESAIPQSKSETPDESRIQDSSADSAKTATLDLPGSPAEAAEAAQMKNASKKPTVEPIFRNITMTRRRVLTVRPTWLRLNFYYYKIYFVFLNTVFASLLPLFLLLFFNISTAVELLRMSRLESRALASVASNVTVNRNQSLIRRAASPNSTNTENAEVQEALRAAVKAHSTSKTSDLEASTIARTTGNGATTNGHALPVFTFTSCDSDNQIDNNVPVDADVLEIVGEQLTAGGDKNSNNKNNNGATSRRPTVTCLVRTGGESSDQQQRSVEDGEEEREEFLRVPTPAGESVTKRTGCLPLNRASFSDARRRASSIFSVNSTTLRLSFAKAIRGRSMRSSDGTNVTSLVVQSASPRASRSTASSSAETKKELKLARISLCIVWLFLFCHFWKLIPTFYSTFLDTEQGTEKQQLGISVVWPHWVEVLEELSHTLITLNSSLNFLIYIIL